MCLRAVRPAHAVRGLEVVLAHQPAHPFLRSADSLDPELRPGLPGPFAMKGRRFEHPANVADQDVVRGRADRPAAPTRHLGRCRLPPRVALLRKSKLAPSAPTRRFVTDRSRTTLVDQARSFD